ncbi:MAG: hypothetical protein AB8I08_17925 [Sandaracinaceae bacterium]
MRAPWIIASCLLAGCIQTGDFDPVGDAASIAGDWTVDGSAPSRDACDALGASVVQVTFLDNARPVTHSGLRFECREGSFDTDAPGGSGRVIAAPDDEGAPWRLRFEAVDSGGQVLAIGETVTVFVPETDKVIMPTANFMSATVLARFVVNGAEPNAERCEEAGFTSVRLELDDPNATAVEDACPLGLVGARLTAGIEHTARLVGTRTDGTEVRSAPVTFISEAGGQTTLDGSPFELSSLGS